MKIMFVEIDELTKYQKGIFGIKKNNIELKTFFINYLKNPAYKKMKKVELIRTLIKNDDDVSYVTRRFNESRFDKIEKFIKL
jgi:hypothetical protein